MSATFSIVIPSFNRAELIGQTLDSILSQATLDLEIIVADDGSTDATMDVLARFGDHITVLNQPNRGPGAARNLGVRHARGDYIVFSDSDDVWFPWTLATYREIVERCDRPSIIAGKLRYFHEEHELEGVAPEALRFQHFPDYFASSRHGLYCGSCQAVIARRALLDVGGFNETRINAEDHDLIMRLGAHPGFVWVEAPDLIGYRQHPQALTHDVTKTYHGVQHLLHQELAGSYPGGPGRASERRRILSQHVRPVCLEMARRGETRKAWNLFRDTFLWNVRLGRVKFLCGMLAYLALRGVQFGR